MITGSKMLWNIKPIVSLSLLSWGCYCVVSFTLFWLLSLLPSVTDFLFSIFFLSFFLSLLPSRYCSVWCCHLITDQDGRRGNQSSVLAGKTLHHHLKSHTRHRGCKLLCSLQLHFWQQYMLWSYEVLEHLKWWMAMLQANSYREVFHRVFCVELSAVASNYLLFKLIMIPSINPKRFYIKLFPTYFYCHFLCP